jgi:hypothetical protein
VENTVEVLSCGCEKEFVGGKWVWYLCEEHDTGDNMDYNTNYSKYRKSFDYEQ